MSIEINVDEIQIKRAISEDKVPVLKDGEPAIAKDSKSLFIGNGGENIKFLSEEAITEFENNKAEQILNDAKAYTDIELNKLDNKILQIKESMVEVVQLTPEQYDTLEVKDENTFYIVSSKYKTVDELEVGSKLKLGSYQVEDENPEEICWVIADKNHEGYPDNSATLLTEKVIDIRAIDAAEPNNPNENRAKNGNNDWEYTNMRQWLNSDAPAGEWYTPQHEYDAPPNNENVEKNVPYEHKPGFQYYFTDREKELILETEYLSRKTNIDGGTTIPLKDKFFLLGGYEVGFTTISAIDGTTLKLFEDINNTIKYPTKQLIENTNCTLTSLKETNSINWFLRTCAVGGDGQNSYMALYNNNVCSIGSYRCNGGIYGIAPACNISLNTRISETPDEDGYYIINHSSIESKFYYGDIEISSGINESDLNDIVNSLNVIIEEKLISKVDKENGKGLSSNDYTTEEKEKLAGIEDNANNYIHPETHPATMIVEDENHKFVSDIEKAEWDSKETTTGSQAKADKALNDAKNYIGLEIGKLVNSAPETLDTLQELAEALGNDPNFATTITTQIGKKAEKEYVDAELDKKVDKVEGKGLSTNDYTTEEKEKLSTIEDNANNYVHPETHLASMITNDETHRFVSDEQINAWDNKMSDEDTHNLLQAFKSDLDMEFVTQEFVGQELGGVANQLLNEINSVEEQKANKTDVLQLRDDFNTLDEAKPNFVYLTEEEYDTLEIKEDDIFYVVEYKTEELIYPTKTIADLAVGDKVEYGLYQVEDETPEKIVWAIADRNHEGYPDNSVTLLTEKIIDLRAFDAMEPSNSDENRQKYGNNRWIWANVNTWLNSDQKEWYIAKHSTDEVPGYSTKPGFLNLFTEAEKQLILDTELITTRNTVTDGGGSDVSTSKVFLLSTTEVGLANENSIAEGSKLALFSNSASRVAYVTQQCFDNTKSTSKPANLDTAWYWWLRTPDSGNSYIVHNVHTSGTLYSYYAFGGYYGLRPALNISNSTLISDEPNEKGYYITNPKPSKKEIYSYKLFKGQYEVGSSSNSSSSQFKTTVTLYADNWNNNFQITPVSGMTEKSTIHVYPYPNTDNVNAISNSGIMAVECDVNTVTFQATKGINPSIDVKFILEVDNSDWNANNVIMLTQAEYDALTVKDDNMFYIVEYDATPSGAIPVSSLIVGDKICLGKYQIEEEQPIEIKWKLADHNYSDAPDNSVTLVSNNILDIKSFDAKESSNPDEVMQDQGNSDYKYSNIRQWLNSDAPAGEWYTPQHEYDAPPTDEDTAGILGYDSRPGFLHYFTEDEKSIIKTTTLNYLHKGIDHIVEDKIFIPNRMELLPFVIDEETGDEIEGVNFEIASTITLQFPLSSEILNNDLISDTFPFPPGDENPSFYFWLRDSNKQNEVLTLENKDISNFYNLDPANNLNGILPICNISDDTLVYKKDNNDFYSVVFVLKYYKLYKGSVELDTSNPHPSKRSGEYFSFEDVDSSFSNETPFIDVFQTMDNRTTLRTIVEANASDYPITGILEVIKLDENNGLLRLYGTTENYFINITIENVNDIFGFI